MTDRRVGPIVLLGLFGFYLATLHSHFSTASIEDDAFIAFRYSQNLALGRGLVFNPGERVWGFTSPFHTLVLVLPALFGVSLPLAASLLGFALLGLTSLVWWKIFEGTLGKFSRVVISAYILTIPETLWFLGLETNLLIFLQSLFVLLMLQSRTVVAAAVGSLACLTRPDAIVLIAPILVFAPTARSWRCLAALLVPGGAWLLFAFLYYGAVLPNTFHAKAGGTPFLEFVKRNYGTMTTLFSSVGMASEYEFSAGWILVPSLALGLVFRSDIRASFPFSWALVFYPWVLLLCYARIGAPALHRWEFYAGAFFLHVAFCAGALSGMESIQSKIAWKGSGVLAFGALAGLVCLIQAAQSVRRLDEGRDFYWKGRRHQTYLRVARWLTKNAPPRSWIASNEPGTIAYYSDVNVLDTTYLVSLASDRREAPLYLLEPGNVPQAEYLRKSYVLRQFFPSIGYSSFSLLERQPHGP